MHLSHQYQSSVEKIRHCIESEVLDNRNIHYESAAWFTDNKVPQKSKAESHGECTQDDKIITSHWMMGLHSTVVRNKSKHLREVWWSFTSKQSFNKICCQIKSQCSLFNATHLWIMTHFGACANAALLTYLHHLKWCSGATTRRERKLLKAYTVVRVVPFNFHSPTHPDRLTSPQLLQGGYATVDWNYIVTHGIWFRERNFLFEHIRHRLMIEQVDFDGVTEVDERFQEQALLEKKLSVILDIWEFMSLKKFINDWTLNRKVLQIGIEPVNFGTLGHSIRHMVRAYSPNNNTINIIS